MRRVRPKHLTCPIAFLLPVGLVSVGAQHQPVPIGVRARAALTVFAEPSPGIEAALAAERQRIIQEAAAADRDAKRDAKLQADADQAAAIEAQHAKEAADKEAADKEAADAVLVAQATAGHKAAAAAQAAAPKAVPKPVVAASTPASTGSGACGGNLPPCYVMERESGGNPTAQSPQSYCGGYGCDGKWQFDPRTWNNYGGYSTADQAPESVQDAKAALVWAGGAGCSNWGAC